MAPSSRDAAGVGGTGAGGTGLGAPGRSTPSIRHSGFSVRTARGEAASSASISGSASSARNWQPEPAACHPSSFTSQRRPQGSRIAGAAATAARRRMPPGVGEHRVRKVPAWNASSSAETTCPIRCTRTWIAATVQSGITPDGARPRTIPRIPRITPEKRSFTVCGAGGGSDQESMGRK